MIIGVVLTGLVLVAAGLYLTTRTVNTTLTTHVIIASDSPNCIELPNILPGGSIITVSQPSGDTIIAILPIVSWKILTESGTLATLNILKQSTMLFRAQSPVFIFNVANRNQYVACVLTNSSIPIASNNTFTVSIYPDRTLGNAMWLSGGGLILAIRGTLGLAGVGRVVDISDTCVRRLVALA